MDVYGGGIAVLFIAICECCSLVWIYGECVIMQSATARAARVVFVRPCHIRLPATFCAGLGRLCGDLEFMLGYRPGFYWRITWGFFAPIILSVGIFETFFFF